MSVTSHSQLNLFYTHSQIPPSSLVGYTCLPRGCSLSRFPQWVIWALLESKEYVFFFISLSFFLSD